MNLREILKFEKENIPEAQWKLEKFLIVFLAVLLGGAFIAFAIGLIVGFTTDGEGVYFLVPEFIWLGAVAVMCVLLFVKAPKVKAEIRAYYYEKLSTEFVVADYEEAKQKLTDNGVINDEGFIASEIAEWTAGEMIAFDSAEFTFIAYLWAGKLFLKVGPFELSADTYNFFRNNRDMIVNKKAFDLFCDDMKKFVELLVRYNDMAKIERKLG